jgi:hypothetical protein
MENGNSLTNGHPKSNQLSEVNKPLSERQIVSLLIYNKLADKSLFISDSFVDGSWISKERQFDVLSKLPFCLVLSTCAEKDQQIRQPMRKSAL